MRDETNVVRASVTERARKRAKMNDTRRLAKQIRMYSKRPRVTSKVSSGAAQECDLPYFLLESADGQNDLPPIPRMKRKRVEGPEVSKSSTFEPSVSISPLSKKAMESSLFAVVPRQDPRSPLATESSHLSDMPSAQPRSTKGKDSVSRHVTGRPSRSKASKRWADDDTWTPPKATLPRVSERPRRLKRCASEAFDFACPQDNIAGAEKELKLPTRVQPKRGRGLPLCPHRVVKVYAKLLARAGPDLKRSARIVAVEKRLHKGYSDVPSLSVTDSLIPKRPNRPEPFTAMARSIFYNRRHRQCWLVPTKRTTTTCSTPP